MTRRPAVRTTRRRCPECGSELEVHIPPLAYHRLGLVSADDATVAWAVSCPAECDGLVRITVGDMRRAQAA